MGIYDVAGAEVIPADVVSGKAAEEQRRLAKGKAAVVDEAEPDRRSIDSACTAEQQEAGRKVQLRKLASMVLGGGPSFTDALEAAIPTEVGQQAPCSGGVSQLGSAASLHARHPSSSSTSSRADVEMAVWDSAGPSRWGSSASDSLCLARRDSCSRPDGSGCSGGSAGPSGAQAGAASSSSSAGAWGTVGLGSSSSRYA